MMRIVIFFFFFQAEDGIRDLTVTGVQTCALPISRTGSTTLVQTGAGLLDRNCRRRVTGMAEPEARREESRRASQPRLEVSQSFREHQDQDRVVRMAGQCARSQTCDAGCLPLRQGI